MRHFHGPTVSILLYIGVLMLGAAIAPTANAAPNSVAADVQYRRGAQAYAAKRYAEALAAFQASQELEPSPNTRFKIAQCFLLLKKIGSAYVHFRRAAGEAEGRYKATNEKRYDLTRQAAILEAAAIEGQVPRLTLAVPSDIPNGFRMLFDGTEVARGAWGVAVEMDPGTHTLTAEGPRLKPYQQTIELRPGQQLRVDVPLQRIATASLVLTYKTKPTGLAVYIDDKPLSIEQLEGRHDLDPGKHKVRASAPGYADFSWSRTLADGDSRIVDVALSPATGTPKWVFFTVGAAALGAATIGTGFGVNAQLASNAEQQKPIADRAPQAKDAIRSDATASTIAFGIAGALGATAIILAITTRWRAPTGREGAKTIVIHGLPILSPHQAGVALDAEF